MVTLTFGKYKGTDIENIPDDYLEWGIERLDSPKWRKEFELELKRRKNETQKRDTFIKQNINTNEAWQMLVKEAESELSDDEDDYRIVRQSDIDALAKEKLQKYQAEIELEQLDTEFMNQWGVTKTQVNKIQNEYWNGGLEQRMFTNQAKYKAACELAEKRNDLIGKIYQI